MFAKTKSLLFITSAFLFSVSSHAAPKMDANGDEQISRIEYMSFNSNAFNKQDKNFDGKLSKQELRDARAERIRESAKKRFKKMDTNHDGKITQQEHDKITNLEGDKIVKESANKSDDRFDKMDTDNNGHVSRLEYKAFSDFHTSKMRETVLTSSQQRFNRMDLDGDGNVTELEYVDKGRVPRSKKSKKSDPMVGLYAHETAKPKKRIRRDGNSDGDITKREDREYNEYQFDRLDKNKDGVITKKEGKFLFKPYKTMGDIVIKNQRVAR